MRTLITGATGFIGRHLVAESVASGLDVRALVRPTSDTAGLGEIELAVGDVTDPASLAPALEGIDVVFHLAAMLKAPWRADFHEANAGGIENIARACADAAKPPRLVIVSSLAAGGPVARDEVRDEARVAVPVSRYGRAKLAGERAAREFSERVSMAIVRPPLVFGEGDKTSLPLFRMAARGISIGVGAGPAPVSVIHARDLAAALLVVADRGERAERDDGPTGLYYATGAPPMALTELGEAIGASLGRKVRTIRLPLAVTWGASLVSEGWGRLRSKPTFLSLDKFREARASSWACSSAKLEALGFAAAPLEQRIAETIDGYRTAGALT